MARVSGNIPPSHSDAYTALALLCQKITARGLFCRTKSRIAIASGSEKADEPALTTFDCHVLCGFHLQSKLRLRSTPRALNLPEASIFGSSDTSASVKRPVLPVTLHTPSGLADGIIEIVKFFGIFRGFTEK